MASWAIIENNNRLLFIKRSVNTSRAGQWCFPGGGIKPMETPAAACLREVMEETGLQVEINRQVAEIDGSFYFLCRLKSKNQEISLMPSECSEYQWVAPHQLLDLGKIMDLKIVVPLLLSLGYQINLSDEVATYIRS